jgi:hypothetical protein
LHFSIWELHLQLLEQVSSSKYFFNGWELYKVGDSREMLVLDCFIPGVGRMFVCTRNKSTTVGVMLWLQLLKHSFGPIGDSPLLDQNFLKKER